MTSKTKISGTNKRTRNISDPISFAYPGNRFCTYVRRTYACLQLPV